MPDSCSSSTRAFASALARRRGGGRPTYHYNPAMMAAVAEIRMRGFRDALRAGRR